jgi:hypothetical protein
VFTRLRASGARAIWVGAIAGEKRLAYALASDIAGRIGVLSGASGVSTAAASSLVALNPKLSSSFSANPDRSEGEEALRRRVHAFNELLEAVADEAPTAVFIDDVHWGDPTSRQLLKSSFARIGDCRILLVTSARLVPDADLNLPVTERLSLEPLDRGQVRELVSGFGSLPPDHWSMRFTDLLHEHTAGSPLLVLDNLHLAIERGLLSLENGEWRIEDAGPLLESISRGDALDQRLKKLDMRLFRTLLVLAVAEEPTTAAVIAAALAEPKAAVDSDLATLDHQGLAASLGDEWRCAHDSIAETMIRMIPGDQRAALQGALGSALSRSASSDLGELRVALRHLEVGGRREEIEELFSRAIAIARASGDRRSNLQIAAALLGETTPSAAAARLVESLPLSQRIGLSGPGKVAAMSAVVLAAFVIPYQMQSPQPSHIAITTQPLSGNTLIVPPPVVEIQDRNGRRITDASDTVFVESVEQSPGISGTVAVAAREGRAEFKDLSVAGEGPVTLRFRAKGLKEAVASTINVAAGRETLRFVQGRINGQELTPTNRTFVVEPGAAISGNVMLEYSSYWGSASVILGAAALWGDRRTNFLDLAPLFTPAQNQPRRASIRFTAPEKPGTYHIVFAFDAEGNVEDFMSGTNWRLPEPIWNDGNDIADWSPAQLRQANTLGWVQSSFVQIDNATGRPRRDPHPVPATVIDVVVK